MSIIHFNARKSDISQTLSWDLEKTACVVIDMWDQHWCKGATKRVGELIPPMNKFLNFLRDGGLKMVAFCPTSVADSEAHKDSSARKRAKQYSNEKVDFPTESTIPDIQSVIDPYAVQCDCEPKCARGKPWTRQNANLVIDAEKDMIFDEKEYYIFHAFEELGIKNLFFLGVHANMCMIYRRFGMKNFNSLKKYNIVLLRDLTDSMTPREEKPYADHFDGLDTTTGFIETYFACSASSREIIGEKDTYPFYPLFTDDVRSKYILVNSAADKDAVLFNQKDDKASSPRTMLSIEVNADATAITDVKLVSVSGQTVPAADGSSMCYSLDKPGEYIHSMRIGITFDEQSRRLIRELHFTTNYDRTFDCECSSMGYYIYEARYTAPKGMAIDSFFGTRKNGCLTSLGVNNVRIQYVCEQTSSGQSKVQNYVQYCPDSSDNSQIFELWRDQFYIYADGLNPDRLKGTICETLRYHVANNAWATAVDGVVFKHQRSETVRHQSAWISLTNPSNQNIGVFRSNADGNIYVPETLRKRDYPWETTHPYYRPDTAEVHKEEEVHISPTAPSKSTSFDDYGMYMSKNLTYPKTIFYQKPSAITGIGIEYVEGMKLSHGVTSKDQLVCFELQEDEFITKMDIFYDGHSIHEITLYTNKGRVHNPMSQTPIRFSMKRINFDGRGLAFLCGASTTTGSCDLIGLGAYTLPICVK